MENFNEQLFNTLNFNVDHANHTAVSDWWDGIVTNFQYTRLYLVTTGNAEINLIDKTLHLQEGMMYLIPPNSVLSGKCAVYMDHYWIHLIADTLTENIIQYSEMPLAIPAPKHAEQIFELIQSCYTQDSEYDRIVVNHSIKLLLAEFFKDGFKLNPQFFRFQETIEYINKNIENDFTISDLANRIHLHPTYFSNQFTKVFKQPPQTYILQRKLNFACKYLISTEMQICEIAERLNFYDTAYFSRIFKQHFNFSPSDFRSNFKNRNKFF